MSAKKRVLVAVGALMAIPIGLILYIPLQHLWNIHSTRRTLSSNSRYYEAAVAAVESEGLKRSERVLYQVPSDWDYKTLIRRNPKSTSPEDQIMENCRSFSAWRDRRDILFVGFGGNAVGYNLLYCSQLVDDHEITPYAGPGWVSSIKPHWWFVFIPK